MRQVSFFDSHVPPHHRTPDTKRGDADGVGVAMRVVALDVVPHVGGAACAVELLGGGHCLAPRGLGQCEGLLGGERGGSLGGCGHAVSSQRGIVEIQCPAPKGYLVMCTDLG